MFNKQFVGLENQGGGNIAVAVSNSSNNLISPKTVLRDHWNTYITEDDFVFMSSNGLTAVRIPVGWWIAQDPTPPKPFVGGS